MTISIRGGVALHLGALALASVTMAQWPDDPAENLAIADHTSDQVIPKVASTSDGGCYVGWFDHAFGNYDVYLQRLDADGFEQWPHNGISTDAKRRQYGLDVFRKLRGVA